jgi:hypothetical protein
MARDRVQVIIPTAINVLTAMNELLITRAKAGDATDVTLPSLRRRALMVVKETGVLTIQLDVPNTETDFTR